MPPPATPEQVAAVEREGLTVLEVRRHPHKLRTGHLRGNRFVLRVRGVGDGAIAAARAEAILATLAIAPGAPNWFGEQRFGRHGDNAAVGRALVTGADTGRRIHPRDRRLYVSALQSDLFNRWLERRLADDLYRRVIAGDLLQKRASGGMFPTEAADVDQPRLDAGEIVATGPMFGHRMRAPADGTEAARREAEILAEAGLTAADFARVGPLGEGTRRPLAIAITDAVARPAGDGAIDVSFTLPSGAYATAVMREVMKTDAAPAEATLDTPDESLSDA